ncbi:hypothetical protein B0H13DRAFT_1887757 [Mycena leptocephala]|nr:hypothetical protein B0H13DRAFT_1887757 [Mycena leptocephala]
MLHAFSHLSSRYITKRYSARENTTGGLAWTALEGGFYAAADAHMYTSVDGSVEKTESMRRGFGDDNGGMNTKHRARVLGPGCPGKTASVSARRSVEQAICRDGGRGRGWQGQINAEDRLDNILGIKHSNSVLSFNCPDQLYLQILASVPEDFHPELQKISALIKKRPNLGQIGQLLELQTGELRLILRGYDRLW